MVSVGRFLDTGSEMEWDLTEILSVDSRRCLSKCCLVRPGPLGLANTECSSWLLGSVLLRQFQLGRARVWAVAG